MTDRGVFREHLFDGQSVIVTGGGTGIGFAIASLFGSLGAKLAICGRRPEPLEEASKKLRERGIRVHAATCDIRQPENVTAFVDDVARELGGVDILVNNAGGQFPSPAEHIPPKGFEAVVRNNLLGTWTMTHAVANRVMIPQKRGSIVNIIAQIARGFPGMAHTGAARAGVDNLTKTLAVEWSRFDIRVNAVAPGVIAGSGVSKYPEELLARAERATPIHPLGTTDQVAQLVAFLSSPAAAFISGTTTYIDGAQSLYGDIWQVVRQ